MRAGTLHGPAVAALLALAGCTAPGPGEPVAFVATSACRGVVLGNGWFATAFHCAALADGLHYVAHAGDAMLLRADGAAPRPDPARLRCEPVPPRRAWFHGRPWPVRPAPGGFVLEGASAVRGESGTPVHDESGRVWGVVSMVGRPPVVAPLWPLCGRAGALRAAAARREGGA